MTQPRFTVPGMTTLVTRRTLRRYLLLRPDPEVTEAFEYLLAVLAQKHGIDVHAAVLMSSHYHMTLTDKLGPLPGFLAEFHRVMALVIKVLLKWEGPVWDHEPTSVVHLRTPQAFIEKSGYAIANPSAAGLVRRARQWPGLVTLPEQLGIRQLRGRRPKVYLDPGNPCWPDEAVLQLTLPARLPWDDDEVRQLVADEVQRLEQVAAKEVRAKGWTVMGKVRARKVSPYKRAKSFEPIRGRNPTFAVGRGYKEAFFEAVLQLRSFRRLYRAAREQWRQGVRDVVFPVGTYLMRLQHSVQVAAP